MFRQSNSYVRSNHRRRNAAPRRFATSIERLEDLRMLSATTVLDGLHASRSSQISPLITNHTAYGYTPAQIQQAYGFNQILFNGIIHGDGAGQTIAIVDAFNDPNIAKDLKLFDTQFGLPAPPKFTKHVPRGTKTNAGWSLEIALDVEWAHAIAPKANILLAEAKTNSFNDLLKAVDYARNRPGVSVVSMSWGDSEFWSESFYDSYFSTPAGHAGVSFVASSGDDGAVTSWPAVSPNVLAVGGTALTLSQGDYGSESGWSGSGGGYSVYESEPTYQQSVQSTGSRSFPDVAYDGDPNTGFAVYDSVTYQYQSGWFQVGGTSAGAPQWAALIAIVNQGRALAGQSPLSNAQSLIYGLPSSDFHDIQAGSNGYSAGFGYDLVTGSGTPYADLVVASLVAATGSSSLAQSNAVTISGASGLGATQVVPVNRAPATTIAAINAPTTMAGAGFESPSNGWIAILAAGPSRISFATATPAVQPAEIARTLGASPIGDMPVPARDLDLAMTTDHDVRAPAFTFPADVEQPLESATIDSNETVTVQTDACFTNSNWIADSVAAVPPSTVAVSNRTSPAAASMAGVALAWGVRWTSRSKKSRDRRSGRVATTRR